MDDFLVSFIGFSLLLFAAGWFIGTYPGIFWIIVLIAIGVFVVRFLIKRRQADNGRRAEETVLAYQGQIISLCTESVVAFENTPKDLMNAEQVLDAAEAEFQDRAFSPFWDSIEGTMDKLGAIDGSIKLIADRSSQYRAAERLQSIVRKAQRNVQFATIYEQRKTSDIPEAGKAQQDAGQYSAPAACHLRSPGTSENGATAPACH